MSNTVTYKLRTPITIDGGAHLHEVTLREPTVDDMIASEEDGAVSNAMAIALVLSRMCGLTLDQFRKVSSRDAKAIKKLADTTWGEDAEDSEGNGSADGATSPS